MTSCIVLAVHEKDPFVEKSEIKKFEVDNGALKMEYYTYVEGDKVKMKGKIELDANKVGSKWHFKEDESSVRVGMEFAPPNTFLSARTDRIYWQGTVGDGKFDDPKLFNKDEELRYEVRLSVNDYWFLSSLAASEDAVTDNKRPYFLDTSKSDIKMTKSEIKKDPVNTALIEFERDLVTESDLTINLQEGAIYILYLSWSVFPNKGSMPDVQDRVTF